MSTPYDFVLLRLKPMNTEISFSTSSFLIDYSFNPSFHQNLVGDVVMLPNKFSIPTKDTVKRGIEWLPDIDLNVGDRVIVDYFQLLQHFGKIVHRYSNDSQELYIRDGNDFLVFVNYHELFCKIDPIVPLNGWVIYEGIYDDESYGEFKNKLLSEKMGRVKYVGKSNLEYQDGSIDVDGFDIGDIIIFKKGFYRKLENDLYATQDKNYYLTQKRWILATLKNQ